MKSFKQFSENLAVLQQNLNVLSRRSEPKKRLAMRNKEELQKSKSSGYEFNKRSADEVEATKNRMT